MSSQKDFADALLASSPQCPPGLCSSTGSDPARRFAVYRNNVRGSLLNALADSYPVVAQLVGEEFFEAMGHVYISAHPPRSPLLNDYGQDFADFIQGFAPAGSLPYLGAVARLERLRVEAYHAADAQPLEPSWLLAAMNLPEHLGQLQLHLHPSLRSLHSNYAVVSLWAAHQDGRHWPSFYLHREQHALILRNGLEVQVLTVDAGCLVFIDSLRSQQPLAIAAAHALDVQADFDLGRCLGLLLGHGALIDLPLQKKS